MPSWEEALVNAKRVAGGCKSERSPEQRQRTDVEKSDIRLTNRGRASHRLRKPKDQP